MFACLVGKRKKGKEKEIEEFRWEKRLYQRKNSLGEEEREEEDRE